MAESVVSFAGQTIGKLLIDEAKFLWGVKGKIKDLQEELKLIQGLLRDADARREREEAVKVWVAQLQDIAYDAEDFIERYIFKVAPKKEQNIIKAYACFVAKCTCVQVHAVGIEIDGLKSSISKLRTSMREYGITIVNVGEGERAKALTRKRTYAHFEEDFVGREDSIQELVKELLKDGNKHRVISIWGMGGLGKTTLAKKVLANDEVKKSFDGFAWAYVSREYNVKDIFVGILVKLIPDQREKVMKMIDNELVETLYRLQQEKKFVVVLDDIWTEQAWDDLQAAFPVENTRSKLLITTRNKKLAEYIEPQGFFYKPRFLSHHESWDLLRKRAWAFPEREVITDNKERLGDELLEKCGGLPLAVIVVAGLLAVNKWEMVRGNINSHFGEMDDVLKVLALSYDDLPIHLKPCFLYLGSFPIDEEIPATKVLYMWIAEGFVSANANDEDIDVAEQYLMELVNRGMVQVRFTLSGKIKTCRLHDMMRDFCISMARKVSFLSILSIQRDGKTEDCPPSMSIEVQSTCKTRRLSFDMRVSAKGNTIPRVDQIAGDMTHLRTLMFFNSGVPVKGTWKQFQPFFINCKFLRVLKLEYLSRMRGNLPESVGDLVHLRYLSLAGSAFKGLPQSMGYLVCMDFLDLHVLEVIEVTVPNVLWKMTRLRHLSLPIQFAIDNSKKLRLDSLKYLRTLRNFSPKNCDVNDLGKQTNLRKLTVPNQYGPNKLELISQLAKFTFTHLHSSSFRFSRISFTEDELSIMSRYHYPCKLSIRGNMQKLPEHKSLPHQLKKLVLIDSQLEEDPMPILEKLNNLVALLLDNAFVGKEMVCSAGGFPQLKHLVLHDLQNLEEWRVAEGAMSHLSRLGISKCFKLKTVPQGVSEYDGSVDIADEYWKQNVMMRRHLIKRMKEPKEFWRFALSEEEEEDDDDDKEQAKSTRLHTWAHFLRTKEE